MREGVLAAACAYLIWGLFPLFWKQLETVPSLQVMAHRIVWCTVAVLLVLALREGFGWIRRLSPRLIGMLALSASLVGCNWWLYIWAVNSGHIVETSLGYFINPLVSVLLGIVVLRERLNRWQWLAIACAATGVVWLAWHAGHPPWIALALAASFGSYGLIRKLAVVPAVQGLAVESLILLLPALTILGVLHARGVGVFGHAPLPVELLLIVGGPVTALPLVLFAIGARRIPLSLIGILQYIAPSLQLATGVLIYREPFSATQALGFAGIWLALLIYSLDGWTRSRRAAATS